MTAARRTGSAARRRIRRAAVIVLVAVGCGLLATGGLWVGLRLATPGTYGSALGTASFQVRPSAHGNVEVFIPLADWGLRAHAFQAPLSLHVEPRVLNREALIAAAQGNSRILDRAMSELRHDASRAISRSARFAALGVLIAALAGLAVLRIAGVNRRRTLIAIPAGVVVAGALIAAALLWQVTSSFEPHTLTHPTYYARGTELIQLLDAAEHANRVGDSYVSKIQGTLSGFAGLLTNPAAGQVSDSRRALLVSDLHNNTLALSSLSTYAQGQPVFFVGDFGNTGDQAEARSLAPAIARFGSPVVAVSGDHDSTAMMRALARRGVIVLTSRGRLVGDGRYGPSQTTVDGRLRVAGYEDPLQYSGRNPDSPRRIFSFSELANRAEALGAAQIRLLTWFRSLRPKPDVVLVHENGLAQYLAQELYDDGYTVPLTILTGHDHIQHVSHKGPIAVVDAGTVGAGGIYGVGADYVGLGELYFASATRTLTAADMIQIEPVSGAAQAQRVVLPDCLGRATCGQAVDYLDPREGPDKSPLGGASPISPLSPRPDAHLP